jgi:hypothetical protein
VSAVIPGVSKHASVAGLSTVALMLSLVASAAAAAAAAALGNRLEALVRCSLPSASSSNELILTASNTNDPFNPGNNVTFAEDFFRVWQDEVARIKVVVSRAC